MNRKIIIISEYGLHARPATKLVNLAMEFDSDIVLTAFNRSVNLKSIMGVMSLGIYSGEEIIIEASGSDEKKAIEELTNFLVTEGLGQIVHE